MAVCLGVILSNSSSVTVFSWDSGEDMSPHLDSISRDPHGPLGPTTTQISHDSQNRWIYLLVLTVILMILMIGKWGSGDLPTRTMDASSKQGMHY